MTQEEIIKSWRTGVTTIQIAKEYMRLHNKKVKKEERITKIQALAYVEPIIFEYETKDWRNK